MRLGFAIAAAAPVAASTGPAAPFILAAAAVAPFLGKIFGFGPDPEQKAYDQLREEYLQAYHHLADSVEPYLENISREDLGRMIATLDTMASNFNQATEHYLDIEDRNWILPRFRDVYNPMMDTLDRWREYWFAKPAPEVGILAPVQELFTAGGVNLLPWALGLGAFLLFRRR